MSAFSPTASRNAPIRMRFSTTTCRNIGRSGRELERLDVPFYLHPRNPLPQDARIYQGAEWLIGPTWAFAQETAVHALRLMGSGLFDRHPRLKIVIGHMGEGIPFNLWRVDNRNAWVKGPRTHPGQARDCGLLQRELPHHGFRKFLHPGAAGQHERRRCRTASCSRPTGRLRTSITRPIGSIRRPIAPADRLRIGRTNAVELFKLDKHLAG